METIVAADPATPHEALQLDAVYLGESAVLRAVLDSPGLVVSDLSLGCWRSHQVARELSAGLGLSLPLAAPLRPSFSGTGSGLPSYADLVGEGIDAESSGNRTALRARLFAEQVAGSCRGGALHTFLVIAPRFGLPWEPENLLFLTYLLRAPGSSGRLLLGFGDHETGEVPSGWALRWLNEPATAPVACATGLQCLVPGVLDRETIAALYPDGAPGDGSLLALTDGRCLIAPSCRRAPADTPRLQFDRLAVEARSSWLKAYAQCYGNNMYVEPDLLCREAWQRFADGSGMIALRLIERAIACAKGPVQQAQLRIQAQGMRIALLRFDEASALPDPSPAVPQSLRGFLMQTKGWGLVMSAEHSRAAPYMEEARRLLDPVGREREHLYLLNISALSRLKAGDSSGALAIEQEIELRLAALPERDRRLEYVNAINTARLYRQFKDLEASDRYYRKAFATTLGARSESDLIYGNVCMARVHAERGRLQEAFLCWLRAGLHFACCLAPEALASRATAAIVGRRWPSEHIELDEVPAALAELLRRAAGAIGLRPQAVPSPVLLSFVRADQADAGIIAGSRAIFSSSGGWVVLASAVPSPPRHQPSASIELCTLLIELLAAQLQDSTRTNVRTLVVDDRLGREIPASVREAVEICVRLGVDTLVLDGAPISLPVSIRDRLMAEMRVRLGDAVERLDMNGPAPQVIFKRYLPDLPLTQEQAAIVACLHDRPAIKEIERRYGSTGSATSELVRALEAARVVNLELTEDACTAAGIKLPSSVI